MPFDLNSTPVRSAIAAALLVIGLIVGWFGHKAISAPLDIATVSVYQYWRVACPQSTEKDATCNIQQDVIDNRSHNELAQLVIFRDKGVRTLILTVPFNVLLEPGMGLILGNDKPRLYQYWICGGNGCLVRIPFDDALAQALTTTPQARILLMGLDRKAVAFPFSLKGYKEALEAYNSAEAKRHSWWRRLWS